MNTMSCKELKEFTEVLIESMAALFNEKELKRRAVHYSHYNESLQIIIIGCMQKFKLNSTYLPFTTIHIRFVVMSWNGPCTYYSRCNGIQWPPHPFLQLYHDQYVLPPHFQQII